MGDGNGKIIEQFTYEETNQKSNQIANYLIENCSINSEDKIGIFMLNSSEFVFSILATHKTGAIQVPVNKDEKGERLLYVINYSEMKVLIIEPYYTGSHKKWVEGFKKYSSHHVKILSMEGQFWKWRMHGGAVSYTHLTLPTNREV